MTVKSRKAEYSEATRSALLQAARELFAERGYANTPIEEVVQRARVTRGALYHHFRDKRELFQAVFEEIEKGLMQRTAAAAMGGPDPWARTRAGCEVYLEACREPEVQRIVLQEAPSVLGWETWREIDAKYGLGLIRAILQELIDAGLIEHFSVDLLSHMLLGAMTEASMAMAGAKDAEAACAEVASVLMRFLRSLQKQQP